MSVRNTQAAALFSAALISAPAAAATLHEGAGNFSNNWTTPTVLASGTKSVTGTGAPDGGRAADRFDVFQFSGLAPGATSVVFDFSLTGPLRPHRYAGGGGSIYYSFLPFSGAYYSNQEDGAISAAHDLFGGNFSATYDPWAIAGSNRGASSFSLDLGDDFAGDLFLALDFTYGAQISYDIQSPSWDTASSDALPSAVPLPASVLMLIAAISGVGFVARCRKSV